MMAFGDDGLQPPAGPAMQKEGGRLAAPGADFDVTQGNTGGQSGSQGLAAGLLCRPSLGQYAGGVGHPSGQGLFLFGIDPGAEPVAMPLEDSADAVDIDHVIADTQDHAARPVRIADAGCRSGSRDPGPAITPVRPPNGSGGAAPSPSADPGDRSGCGQAGAGCGHMPAGPQRGAGRS